MKDLIIGAIANYTPDKIRPYINSVNSCGFSGDKIMITYNIPHDTSEYLQSNGWQVYSSSLVGHPHMQRLIDIYRVLSSLKSNGIEYRYVITTDVRDVIFQTDPSKYLEANLQKQILVSSENVLYKDEPWGQKNILEGYGEIPWPRYKDNVTCNVGVLAGYYSNIMDLLLLNYLVSQAGNTQHFTDQSSFNFIIHNELVKNSIQIEGIESNWALQIGTLSNPNFIGKYEVKIIDGKVFHNTDPFVIVHQYDRHPYINEQITKLYI